MVKTVQRGLANRGYDRGPIMAQVGGGPESGHSISHLQRLVFEALEEP